MGGHVEPIKELKISLTNPRISPHQNPLFMVLRGVQTPLTFALLFKTKTRVVYQNKKNIILVTCLFFILSGFLSAQQLITPWSFSSDQGGMSVSLSMGEPMTGQYNSTSKIVTMGFHQGKSPVISSLLESKDLIYISVFPNPATSFIHVVSDAALGEIYLFDVNGRVAGNYFIHGQPAISIPINLSAGTYFIKAAVPEERAS